MVAMLQFAHIDMNGNEIQNVLAQNLASAPTTNVAAGRFYFNTADHTLYVYNGTAWVDALSQGDYTFQNGIEEIEIDPFPVKAGQTFLFSQADCRIGCFL